MSRLAEFAINHPILVFGLVAAWVAVMVYELRRGRRGSNQVSAAEAVRLINKGALVIDVRKPEEYHNGHIVNSRNVELARIADKEAIKKQKTKVLLTVCDNGRDADRAAGALRKAGYEAVFSLKGGLAGWRSDNLPLVR